MNNTFSLEQISRTKNFDTKLKLRQHKLDLMAQFMGIKIHQPKVETKRKCKRNRFHFTTLQI